MTDTKTGINLKNYPSEEEGKEQKKQSLGCVTFEIEKHASTCNNRQESTNIGTTNDEIVATTANQTETPVESR